MIPIRRDNLEELAQNHYENLKEKIGDLLDELPYSKEEILLAKPEKLEKIKSFQRFTKKEDLLKLYKNFTNIKDEYNAYKLIRSLNIQSCPYCNRNTIYNLKDGRRTSELDHFYPKEKYPFLALSFYNLIPSCKVCNHIKRSKDIEYINPYDERFDFNKNFKFKLKIEKSDFYNSVDGFDLKLKGKSEISFDEKIRSIASIKDLKLKDLYENHKDIVLDLIQKEYIYNETYIDEIYKSYEGTLFKNREDLLKNITCGIVEDKDLDKRPLSKLIKDISEDLDLL